MDSTAVSHTFGFFLFWLVQAALTNGRNNSSPTELKPVYLAS